MKRMRSFVLSIICITGVYATGITAVIHVPEEQPTIQAGIEHAATGDTVLVADGTYRGAGNKNLSFLGKQITVLSQNGSMNCVIDCEHAGSAFIFNKQESTESILEGFTVINGYASPSGGGIRCYGSSPTIRHCTIAWNSAELSCAGILVLSSEPILEECLITNNRAPSAGGVEVTQGSELRIIRCEISNNSADYFGAGVYCLGADLVMTETTVSENIAIRGAGIYCANGSLSISSCMISDNVVEQDGGGISYLYDIYEPATFVLDSTQCIKNTAGNGGALFIYVANYVFQPEIRNSVFIGNTVDTNEAVLLTESGGAIAIRLCSPEITGCTFDSNSATLGGAICIEDMYANPRIGGSPAEANSFANNTALAGADLYCKQRMEPFPTPVMAQYNKFRGYPFSDYYVAPPDSFNLWYSTFETTPITQDTYVSPDGDDNNSGLSWDEAFRSITYAYRMAFAESRRITIHVAPGTYSPVATGEVFPIPIVSDVSLSGESADATILVAEQAPLILAAFHDSNLVIENLTLTQAKTNGAILCAYSDCTISNCQVRENTGGGIVLLGGEPSVSNCFITMNLDSGINADGSIAHINNCLITLNSASEHGGGILWQRFITSATKTPLISNCTITGNAAPSGAGLATLFGNVTVINSIIWGNYGSDNIHSFLVEPTIAYSDIGGGWEGEGNINADPLFISSPRGAFCLSQIETGQSTQSPCVDSGLDNSADWAIVLDQRFLYLSRMTTSVSDLPDAGRVDMGFHYMPATPIPELGVIISMPRIASSFQQFRVDGYLMDHEYPPVTGAICFVFQFFDSFYFWPSWTYYFPPHHTNVDYIIAEIPAGTTHIEVIPPSILPDFGSDYIPDLYFYGALLSSDLNSILGEMAVVPWSIGVEMRSSTE